jgi:DNA-binding NtrC family response regulator
MDTKEGSVKSRSVLITEREQTLRRDLKGLLSRHGFDVIEAADRTDVLQFFLDRKPDLVIIGSCPNSTLAELKVAEEIRLRNQKVPLILITRYGSENQAIAALRAGVNDYFVVPFSYEELLAAVKRTLSHCKRNHRETRIGNTPMIGGSSSMRDIKDCLMKIAATDCTVLITGETGTGKELVAEMIHWNSPRHKRPFVCINSVALPESLFESELFGHERGSFTGAYSSYAGKLKVAEGGTVFFDEMGDMAPSAQAKILRVIEGKKTYRLGGKEPVPVDVRIIAATNQDPERLVTEGKFREDLYYRINVARIHLPPLRDRKEEIVPLIEHYTRELNLRYGREVEGFTEEALTSLLQYDWPGNVRELKNLLEATFINLPSRKITLIDLPEMFQRKLKELKALPQGERDRVISALFACNWNKSMAARKLRWSRMTLYRKMAKYRIIAKPQP